jgi:hypothetical protein
MTLRTIRLVGLIALALTLNGCATMQVRSYVAPGLTPREHRTYNWASAEPRPTGDPRLDSNRFFEERVRSAVEKQLDGRGFEKTADARSLAALSRGCSPGPAGQRLRTSWRPREDCRPEVYDAGTLLIDLVDAKTNRLLWRGWAEGSIDGVVDDQEWMEQRIDETVTRILRQLPQRL